MSVELFRVVDRVDREDQGHHVDRADRVDHAVLVDHVDRVDRADRAVLVDRVDRADRAELVDRVDRVDRAVHVDRVDRVDRVDYFIDDDIVDVKVDTNVEGTTYMIAEGIVTGDDDNVSDDVTGVVEVDVFGELGKLVELKHITY